MKLMKKRKTSQIGGAVVPWVVDFEKGGEIVSDLVKKGFKKVDHSQVKKDYNKEKSAWKSSGSSKSFSDWSKDHGSGKFAIEKSKCVIL